MSDGLQTATRCAPDRVVSARAASPEAAAVRVTPAVPGVPGAPTSRGTVLLMLPWDQTWGGVFSVARNVALVLQESAWRPLFLHPGGSSTPVRHRTATGFDGYQVRLREPIVPGRALKSVLAFLLTLPLTLLRLRALVKREHVSVVNVHYANESAVYFGLLRLLGGPALVTSVHGADLFPAGQRPHRHGLALRALLALSDVIVAPSRSFRDDVVAALPGLAGKVRAIHNGVDLDELGLEEAPATPAADASPVIVMLAALRAHKGIDVLLRAFAALAPEHPGAQLLVGGCGPEEASLLALAEDLGVRDRVKFPGTLSRVETADALRRAAVVVHCSRVEPFGLAVAEGLAAARPVVATRVGGIPEIVEHEVSGLLVPPDDPEALAAALRRLLTERDTRARMGRAGRAAVLGKFLASHMGREYDALFRGLSGVA